MHLWWSLSTRRLRASHRSNNVRNLELASGEAWLLREDLLALQVRGICRLHRLLYVVCVRMRHAAASY